MKIATFCIPASKFSVRLAVLALCAMLSSGAGFEGSARATVITLDFAQNPTLPSAQGMSFATDSGRPESDFASILDGNRLMLDSYTSTLPNTDRMAYYYKDNVFDHTIDLEMEVRVKIIESSPFGFGVAVFNANAASHFIINKTGFQIYQVTSGSGYDFSSGFNTFKYKGFGATNTYEFFVNGSKVAFGSRPGGYANSNQFYFGDGTPTGGNARAEVQYLRYSNVNLSSGGGEVPEPISLATWSLLAGSIAWRRARRR
ncbi:MAG: hypothetical protein NTV29_10925 [Planctomycetota bacterium]|nr:hypothetical protein [Planctomycetota bacterium]